MIHLNEYTSSEYEKYVESGLEGVSAKDVLLNIYPETINCIIKDFDKQCDESTEFKNKNLDMLRSIIVFSSKYFNTSTYIKSMKKKYNII